MWEPGDVIYYVCSNHEKYLSLTTNKKYIVIKCYMEHGWKYVKIINDDGHFGSYFMSNFKLDELSLRKYKIRKLKERINDI